MVFSSLEFIYIFLPLVICFYYMFKNNKAKNLVLLFFSLIFYSFGEPKFILLLLATSILNFLIGIYIYKFKNTVRAKIALIIAVVFDIGALIFFKYLTFILININDLFSLNIEVPNIILPIGISFYTFQILTYVIDVYLGNVKAQYSYTDFLLYITMFTQLIAGPIVRYIDVQNQIKKRKTTINGFFSGIVRFLVGLSKKVIIANHAGEVVAMIFDFNVTPPTTYSVWYGVIMFSIQIYYDFSGYSDMAIGLGRMFGFEFVENFNYPYISNSITDFWRRWHMSLGTFFRDYVYIPLGGNRKHQIRNIVTVWALTGIWHGASWNFLFWGLFFAIILIFEKIIFLKVLKKLPRILAIIYTMFFVLIGWIIFYFVDTNDMLIALKVLFVPTTSFQDAQVFESAKINIIFIIISYIGATPLIKIIAKKFENKFLNNDSVGIFGGITVMFINAFLLYICTGLLTGSNYNPFLYFRF